MDVHFRNKKKVLEQGAGTKIKVSREAKSIHKWSLKPVSVLMLSRFVSSLKITEDFIAAYQANYGFTKEGEPDANSAAVSSTDPEASEKEKKGDDSQKPKPDEQETPAKEAKQKGEKRKLEPGSATSKHREERGNRGNTQIGIK